MLWPLFSCRGQIFTNGSDRRSSATISKGGRAKISRRVCERCKKSHTPPSEVTQGTGHHTGGTASGHTLKNRTWSLFRAEGVSVFPDFNATFARFSVGVDLWRLLCFVRESL